MGQTSSLSRGLVERVDNVHGQPDSPGIGAHVRDGNVPRACARYFTSTLPAKTIYPRIFHYPALITGELVDIPITGVSHLWTDDVGVWKLRRGMVSGLHNPIPDTFVVNVGDMMETLTEEA